VWTPKFGRLPRIPPPVSTPSSFPRTPRLSGALAATLEASAAGDLACSGTARREPEVEEEQAVLRLDPYGFL
jgi:hypothetical protein